MLYDCAFIEGLNFMYYFLKEKKALFIKLFVLALCFWLVVIAALPKILSNGLLERHLNKKIKGHIHFEKMKLSWFKAQSFHQVEFIDPSGQLMLKIAKVETTASLINLFFDPTDLKETYISGLDGNIQLPQKNTAGFIASLDPAQMLTKKEAFSKNSPIFILKVPVHGKLYIDQSKMTLQSTDHSTIYFNDIQFNCAIPKNAPSLVAHLTCETSQNNLSGSIHLNVELGGLDANHQIIFTPLERDILFLSPESHLKVTAEVAHLPTDGLDHLLNLYSTKFRNTFSMATGPSLNCGMDLYIAKGKSKIFFSADADRLAMQFSGTLQQNQFSLNEPSICRFQIKQPFIDHLFSRLAIANNWVLESPSEALVQIDRMNLPLDLRNFNFTNLSCNALLSLAPLKFIGNSQSSGFELKHFKGVIDTFDINESITLHLNGLGYEQNRPVHFQLDGQISKLMDQNCSLQGLNQLKGHFIGQIKDCPTQLLTFFSKNKNFNSELLGPITTLDAELEGSLSSADLFIKFNSSRLNIAPMHFELLESKFLKLKNATSLQFRLNPNLAKLALASQFTVLHPVDFNGELKNIEFTLEKGHRTIKGIDLKIQSTPFDFFISNYKPFHTDVNYLHFTMDQTGKLNTLITTQFVIPEDLPFHDFDKKVTGSMLLQDSISFFKAAPSPLQAQFNSSNWSFNLMGSLDKNFNVNILNESYFEYLEPQITFQNVSAIGKNVTVYFEPSMFNLAPINLHEADIKGRLIANQLLLKDEKNFQNYDSMELNFDLLSNKKNSQLLLYSPNKQITATITATPLSQDMGLKNSQYHIDAQFQSFPTDMLNLIAPQSMPVTAMIGTYLSGNIQSSFTTKDKLLGELEFDLKSPSMKSKGALYIDEQFHLKNPMLIEWKLNPDHCAILSQTISYESDLIKLTDTGFLKIKLEALNIPFKLRETPIKFEGSLLLDQLITNKGKLYDLSASFNSSHLFHNLKIDLTAKSHNETLDEGYLYLSAELLNPVDPVRYCLNNKIDGFIQCKLKKFPTPLLHNAMSLVQPRLASLTCFLGTSFDLVCNAKLNKGNGPCDIIVQSEDMQSSCAFRLEQGNLLLSEDLTAYFNLNSKAATDWLSHIHPLFSFACPTKNSVCLTIPKENFILPLNKRVIEQLNLENGSLNIEHLKLNTQGHLKKLLKFLKAKPSTIVKGWFTPITFSINKGTLKIERTDVLIANKYHVALWGKKNLKTNQGLFYLALPHQTLKTAFGFKNLPEHYSFQIPVVENKNTFAVDWATAAAQLGVLGLSTTASTNCDSKTMTQQQQILSLLTQSQPSGYAPACRHKLPWEEKQLPKFVQNDPDDGKERSKILYQLIQDMRQKVQNKESKTVAN